MFLIYFRNAASHRNYVYHIPHIMSLSMHHIIYSLYEMMRIICDPKYTMNSTWVNTCNRNKYGQCTRFPERISDTEITILYWTVTITCRKIFTYGRIIISCYCKTPPEIGDAIFMCAFCTFKQQQWFGSFSLVQKLKFWYFEFALLKQKNH